MRTWVCLLSLLTVLPTAMAYPESDAALVRLKETGKDDVLRVWHEPQIVEPGTQWRGYIQFAERHGIQSVRYQICRVGSSCFAPPTLADRLNETTWTFHTQDYRQAGNGQPVSWEAGWRLGMRFVINETTPEGAMETSLPEGLERPDDLEYHYLAFDMPPAGGRAAPGSGLLLGLAALGLAGLRRKP